MDVWFVWAPFDMAFYAAMSIFIFAILFLEKREMNKQSFLWGLAASLTSWFAVGLWCVLVVALYCLGAYSLEYFILKYVSKDKKKED